MIKIIVNYFIKPLFFTAPFYIGYKFYTGDYNDFLVTLMLQKIRCEIYFNNVISNLLEYNDDNKEEDHFTKTFLYYNGETKIFSNIDEELEKVSDFPLKLFIRENENTSEEEIIRFENSNDFDIENLPCKIEKPFMQVEITQHEQTFIIDKGLSDLYYNGNKIFDEIFLKWFLDHYKYDFILDDNYIIKIMDNNINFIELSKEDYIILTEDGFDKNGIIKKKEINECKFKFDEYKKKKTISEREDDI